MYAALHAIGRSDNTIDVAAEYRLLKTLLQQRDALP
jgi:hypothetical protein